MTAGAIIFDFNGVIADDEPQHASAFATMLAGENIELRQDDYFRRYLGLDDRDLFRRVLADHGRPEPEGERLAALVAAKADVYRREIEGGVELCKGARQLIVECGAPRMRAIGSGARGSEIALILQQHDIADCFDTIVSADDVRRGKPDPETYALVLTRLRSQRPELVASDCVVIEDAPNGIRAAAAAGMRTIGVCGSSGADELHEADLIVASLEELRVSDLDRCARPR